MHHPPRRRGLAGLAAKATLAAAMALPAATTGAVSARAAAGQHEAAPNEYVAVGDSFASGAGLAPKDSASPGGTDCRRSTGDYAHLLAAGNGWALTDVTCSGGRIGEENESAGQGGGFYRSLPYAQDNPPMLGAVDSRTQYVTFQLGGNDSGITEAMKNCLKDGVAQRNDPRAALCEKRVEEHRDGYRIDLVRTRNRAVKALRAIRRKAPDARVVVLGYPLVLPLGRAPRHCPFTVDVYPGRAQGFGPVSVPDQEFFAQRLAELNTVLRRAAREGGAAFADLARVFQGHDACQARDQRWIHRVLADVPMTHQDGSPYERPANPFSPEGLAYLNQAIDGDGREPLWASGHPNTKGHEETARILATTAFPARAGR
ncbi:SGNH/GDSL hydrolase family protein [Streptomyces sp. NPDC006743]|uniref:SGNH/GDSL hydrolase family protein n=1 Tax=Streptomyces sp. NPDC006743 TaxID=3154480 RepID=UPI003456FE96